MKSQIERSQDVNSAMFAALADIEGYVLTLDDAMNCLHERFGASHPLYWFYRGGHHIAIQSHNHKQRVAVIHE